MPPFLRVVARIKKIMTEDFLQYIWNNGLFFSDKNSLQTTDGEKIKIISRGIHNKNSGPDFFNAKIKIGKTIWVGNAEVHIKSSDWISHSHSQDDAYQNVILHIVAHHNKEIYLNKKEKIPTLILKYDKLLDENYEKLMQSSKWIACQEEINKVDKFKINLWINTLIIERLEKKAEEILSILEKNENNWEESFYQVLLKSFGLKVNAESFLQLAQSLPLKYITKHKDNLLQTESLLQGQAGMLEENLQDEYYRQLQDEYKFLRTKFSLEPLPKLMWKFSKLRPPNFPTIRISQIANLLHKQNNLFSKIISSDNAKQLVKLFETHATKYWDNHFVFGKETKQQKRKLLGLSATDSVIINAVATTLFAYGSSKNDDNLINIALELLEETKIENNSIINNWKELIEFKQNAFNSQALLHLKKNYCDNKKCLDCDIGQSIIF